MIQILVTIIAGIMLITLAALLVACSVFIGYIGWTVIQDYRKQRKEKSPHGR